MTDVNPSSFQAESYHVQSLAGTSSSLNVAGSYKSQRNLAKELARPISQPLTYQGAQSASVSFKGLSSINFSVAGDGLSSLSSARSGSNIVLVDGVGSWDKRSSSELRSDCSGVIHSLPPPSPGGKVRNAAMSPSRLRTTRSPVGMDNLAVLPATLVLPTDSVDALFRYSPVSTCSPCSSGSVATVTSPFLGLRRGNSGYISDVSLARSVEGGSSNKRRPRSASSDADVDTSLTATLASALKAHADSVRSEFQAVYAVPSPEVEGVLVASQCAPLPLPMLLDTPVSTLPSNTTASLPLSDTRGMRARRSLPTRLHVDVPQPLSAFHQPSSPKCAGVVSSPQVATSNTSPPNHPVAGTCIKPSTTPIAAPPPLVTHPSGDRIMSAPATTLTSPIVLGPHDTISPQTVDVSVTAPPPSTTRSAGPSPRKFSYPDQAPTSVMSQLYNLVGDPPKPSAKPRQLQPLSPRRRPSSPRSKAATTLEAVHQIYRGPLPTLTTQKPMKDVSPRRPSSPRGRSINKSPTSLKSPIERVTMQFPEPPQLPNSSQLVRPVPPGATGRPGGRHGKHITTHKR